MLINRIVGGIVLAISVIGLLAALATVGTSPAGAIASALFCLLGLLGSIGLLKGWRYSRTATAVFVLLVGGASVAGDQSGGPISLLIVALLLSGLLFYTWWSHRAQRALKA
jgi:hypothetical protein